jgi:4-hydroxy-tetrahydrodipicolinate reductase
MIRIILSGCNGHMGAVISHCARERGDVVVAGIDPNTQSREDYPVFPNADQCAAQADVIIDFSHPSALEGLLALSRRTGIPLVLATTGMSPQQIETIHQASAHIPVFFTANMSLGINLLTELAKTAVRVLGSRFDIEIIEKHHNRKLDAPSGTALMLADAIASVMEEEPAYVYERHSKREKRKTNEIGLHAVRGGTIVGEHEVIFAGRDEVISLTHIASSRDIFATGALSAAAFMVGKKPGLYSMKDLIATTEA